MRAMAEVIKLWQLAMDRNDSALRAQYSKLLKRSKEVDDELWWRQAQEVMVASERYFGPPLT